MTKEPNRRSISERYKSRNRKQYPKKKKLSRGISSRHFYKFRAHSKLVTPRTQEDWYKGKGACNDTLLIVRQSPNAYSNYCKQMARDAFKLRKPVADAPCDHMDRDGNMYRQIAVRYNRKGVLSSWEHIQPSRPWDYLLLVSLEVKKLRFYKMSRESFNTLCDIGIIRKMVARQQESIHSAGRYSLSKQSFDKREESFEDFVEELLFERKR